MAEAKVKSRRLAAAVVVEEVAGSEVGDVQDG